MTKKIALALISLMVLAFIVVGSASAAPTYAENINVGDTVLVGESGLNISVPMKEGVIVPGSDVPVLAWYSYGSDPSKDVPAKTVPVSGSEGSFYVSPGSFNDYPGQWYAYNGTAGGAKPAFSVYKLDLGLKIFNSVNGDDVTGKKVVTGSDLTFRIDSSVLYAALARVENGLNTEGTNKTGVDINLIAPSGATLEKVYNLTGSTSLIGLKPTNTLWYVNGKQSISAWEINLSRYSAGTYQAIAKCNLNGMKDNLNSITGETVSATGTVEIDKDTVSITADKESVVRNNDFSITIDGKPSTDYYLWISGINSYNEGNGSVNGILDTLTTDVPPYFTMSQKDVTYLDDPAGAWDPNELVKTGLNYTYRGTTTIGADTGKVNTDIADTGKINPYAVLAKTSDDGTITVGLETHPTTKAATYTIRVEAIGGDDAKQLYDTVKVTVEEGEVTITASGDGSYYLGEQITFSGTDTDSDFVYLFIDGPNLYANGANLSNPTGPKEISKTVTGNEATFVKKAVNVDNTWEYKLETSQIGLDQGTYTVYAVNSASDKDSLSGTKYDAVSVSIKKPFVTATVSSSAVAKGDKLYIRGTAEGTPTPGVAIWILGKNYWNGHFTNSNTLVTENVNDDGSFEYEFGSGDTKDLSSGQYFVVVQHPMYNDQFNVYPTGNDPTYVQESPDRTTDKVNSQFVIWGTDNKLQGSDAAEALIEMIDSADIDDTYTKLSFLIEEPWVRINTVGDHYVGDQFTISGTTNLAVDDDLIVEVQSSSFTATQKSQSGDFSGKTETVKVVAGATYNEWSMDVDASTFKADEYIVNVESIETTATATTTFNVLTGGPSTATATATATSGAVTTTATATQSTPTETAAPGFGALVALIGLGAVAALVLRKE